jgi:hypothetical protein
MPVLAFARTHIALTQRIESASLSRQPNHDDIQTELGGSDAMYISCALKHWSEHVGRQSGAETVFSLNNANLARGNRTARDSVVLCEF